MVESAVSCYIKRSIVYRLGIFKYNVNGNEPGRLQFVNSTVVLAKVSKSLDFSGAEPRLSRAIRPADRPVGVEYSPAIPPTRLRSSPPSTVRDRLELGQLITVGGRGMFTSARIGALRGLGGTGTNRAAGPPGPRSG
jgi:hypothetical protein